MDFLLTVVSLAVIFTAFNLLILVYFVMAGAGIFNKEEEEKNKESEEKKDEHPIVEIVVDDKITDAEKNKKP